MAFNQTTAGKWAGLVPGLDQLSGTGGTLQLAGQAQFGQEGPETWEAFRERVKGLTPEQLDAYSKWEERRDQSNFLKPLMDRSLYLSSPAGMKEQLKMQQEAETQKGWKSLAFNAMNRGMENLTRGLAMSMNPYGTMEAAKYAADMAAAAPALMSGAYANVRNPDLARPMVNVGQAPTYF
jgi:hypothetical protein